MEEDSFDQRKSASLKAILNACEFDKSPKGSVDEPIRSLVDVINRSVDFATTSSCSGRISLFHTSGSEVNIKGTGRWLLALHRTLTGPDELARALKDGLDQEKTAASSITVFKHEPFVLHIMCRTVEGAQSMLKLAMDAGFRESGISIGNRKIMVGIRTTSNSLECPVAHGGNIICPEAYLAFIAEEANKRFKENWRRTQQFGKTVSEFLTNAHSLAKPPSIATPNKDLRWVETPPSYALKRWGHTATAIDSNRILIFGGWGESAGNAPDAQDKQQHTHLNHTLVFELANLQPRNAPSLREPEGRVYHATVALPNGSCVLFGGRKSPKSPLNDWWLFHEEDESWEPLIYSSGGPCARWRHSACVMNGLIYVYGGRTHDAILDDFWQVRIRDCTAEASVISSCGGSLPGARFAHAMVATSHSILLHGGLASFEAAGGDPNIFVLDMKTKVWSNVRVEGLPWVFSHCLVQLNPEGDRIIVLGGIERDYNRERVRGLEILDVSTVDQSSRTVQVASAASMLVVQSSAVSMRGGSTLLTFGGGATCFAFGSVFSSSAQLALTTLSSIETGNGHSEDEDGLKWFWSCPKSAAVTVKTELAVMGALAKHRKVITESDVILFPIDGPDARASAGGAVQRRPEASKQAVSASQVKSALSKEDALGLALNGARFKAERMGDVVLIHSREFPLQAAKEVTAERWEDVLRAYPGSKRIVYGAEIDAGPMRKSRNVLLYCAKDVVPETCWVTVKENGVKFSFDMLQCMYSKGNVAEKARFAGLVQPGEVVLDLFAGIGYFTVPALAIIRYVKRLHACEWNPHAVQALRVNLRQNGVEGRCVVHPGDCRLIDLAPDERANRISLGLIPTSRVGWETAVRNLVSEGGWLHVHENVNEDDIAALRTKVETELSAIANRLRGATWTARCHHVQKVKSYAPRVFHVVLDVQCGPATSGVLQTAPLSTSPAGQVPSESGHQVLSPSAKLWDYIRRAADELLCANDVDAREAELLAADAELLFRRLRRRVLVDQGSS